MLLIDISWVNSCWMSLPHISNVAVALIHINYPLIGEKRTIREVTCLRSGLCVWAAWQSLYTSLSLRYASMSVCAREQRPLVMFVTPPWVGLLPVPFFFAAHSVLKESDALIHPHYCSCPPMSVTLRAACFWCFLLVFDSWLSSVWLTDNILNTRIRWGFSDVTRECVVQLRLRREASCCSSYTKQLQGASVEPFLHAL